MTEKIARVQTAVLLLIPAVATFLTYRPHSTEFLVLGIAVWLMALIGVLIQPSLLPAGRPGRIAITGIAALTLLTALSMTWAGVLEPAAAAATLALVYLGFLLAAVPALRERAAARVVEPVLALTVLAATLYGLSERVLPGTFSLASPRTALGRFAEPLGYWNAMGLLCGMGLLLAARIAGDTERPRASRAMFAAATPILAAGLWLAFSRGALAATVAGMVGLVALVATRSQAKSVALALLGAAAAIASAQSLPSVATTQYALDDRASQGAIFGLMLLGAAIAVGTTQFLISGRAGRPDAESIGRTGVRVAAFLTVVVAITPFASVIAGQNQINREPTESGAVADRLASSESNRTRYWSTQLAEFRANPIIGSGAGSFETTWIRERGSLQPARNAHSLEIETAGDLGLLGLTALLLLLGGVTVCARSAWRRDRRLLAGPAAGLIAFASHSAIDWDWQVPGVTLSALLLAALVIAAAERDSSRPSLTQRAAVASLAVVAIAWLGWSLRGIELQQRGERIVAAAGLLGWNEERYSRAKVELESAALYNPWPLPRTLLATAAFNSGHEAEAIAQAQALVDANPGSWFAWGLLAEVVRNEDPALARSALATSQQLRPPEPDATR
ncbi:MAG: O-antigen ligase family protein [Actinomycetes bacterium]